MRLCDDNGLPIRAFDRGTMAETQTLRGGVNYIPGERPTGYTLCLFGSARSGPITGVPWANHGRRLLLY